MGAVDSGAGAGAGAGVCVTVEADAVVVFASGPSGVKGEVSDWLSWLSSSGAGREVGDVKAKCPLVCP